MVSLIHMPTSGTQDLRIRMVSLILLTHLSKISQYRLTKDICVSPRRINEIVRGRRAITADTALRLGRFLNMEAQFWLNLQSHYDMEVALALEGEFSS